MGVFLRLTLMMTLGAGAPSPAFAREATWGNGAAGSNKAAPSGNTPIVNEKLLHFINGNYEKLAQSVKTQYACAGLPADPEERAQKLIAKLAEPRDQEKRIYQAACWESAQDTVKSLKSRNPKLAEYLDEALQQNKNAARIQLAVEACPGGPSDYRANLLRQLQTVPPLTGPLRYKAIKMPPAVSKDESLNQLRELTYSESMDQALNRSMILAQKTGLGTDKILNKICGPSTYCAKTQTPLDLKNLLKGHYETINRYPAERKADKDIYASLQNDVREMDKDAKAFNNTVTCKYSETRICFTKEGKKESESAALTQKFYTHVEDVFSSDEGALLEQEPLHSQIKTFYDGVPLEATKGGKGAYLFVKKYNENPQPQAGSINWDTIPDNLKISGGPSAVHEAAVNSLSGTKKYTSYLNAIEEAVRRGKDPDPAEIERAATQGEGADFKNFPPATPESKTKALMLISSMNPSATARVLVTNPQVAQGELLCKMVAAGEAFEANKEMWASVRMWTALGTGAIGLGMLVIPTGGTQVLGSGMEAYALTLATGSVVLGTVALGSGVEAMWEANEQRLASQRYDASYTATKNIDLKNAKQKASDEMVTAYAAAAGEFTTAAGTKALVKGIMKTVKTSDDIKAAQKILEVDLEAAKKGESVFTSEIKNPADRGEVLGDFKDPKVVAKINQESKKNSRIKRLFKKLSDCYHGTAAWTPAASGPIFLAWSALLASPRAEATECPLPERKNIEEKIAAEAHVPRPVDTGAPDGIYHPLPEDHPDYARNLVENHSRNFRESRFLTDKSRYQYGEPSEFKNGPRKLVTGSNLDPSTYNKDDIVVAQLKDGSVHKMKIKSISKGHPDSPIDTFTIDLEYLDGGKKLVGKTTGDLNVMTGNLWGLGHFDEGVTQRALNLAADSAARKEAEKVAEALAKKARDEARERELEQARNAPRLVTQYTPFDLSRNPPSALKLKSGDGVVVHMTNGEESALHVIEADSLYCRKATCLTDGHGKYYRIRNFDLEPIPAPELQMGGINEISSPSIGRVDKIIHDTRLPTVEDIHADAAGKWDKTKIIEHKTRSEADGHAARAKAEAKARQNAEIEAARERARLEAEAREAERANRDNQWKEQRQKQLPSMGDGEPVVLKIQNEKGETSIVDGLQEHEGSSRGVTRHYYRINPNGRRDVFEVHPPDNKIIQVMRGGEIVNVPSNLKVIEVSPLNK